MSNKQSFEILYKNLQENQPEEMNEIINKVNKENKKRKLITLIISLIICGLAIPTMVNLYISMGVSEYAIILKLVTIIFFTVPLLFIYLFIYIILFFSFSKERRNAERVFKQVVIKQLIENFYDELHYVPNGMMPRQIYEEGKYNEHYNKYYSDDYIEAKIENKYPIKIAEVRIQREETHKDSEGNTKTTTYTIFNGIFAKITIDKSIKSDLTIKQNGTRFNKDKLKMDSSEFEKYFDVCATNKIVGMQILTADIMEILIDFQNKTGLKYDISIYNNEIYLRFNCGPVFELNSFKKGMLPENTIKKYYNILDFTYKLSKQLVDVINETEI